MIERMFGLLAESTLQILVLPKFGKVKMVELFGLWPYQILA